MLPAAAYTDPAVLAWERAHLFAGGWVAVAHASSVAADGSQLAAAVGSGSVLVFREGDAIRGFANVCRHRGHELLGVGERACRDTLRCPYHGWTYDLDGRRRAASTVDAGGDAARGVDQRRRARHGSAGFDPDPDGHALGAIAVEEHLGWVFANGDGRAPPIADVFGGLDSVLGPYDAGALALVARHTYDVAANWKVIHENYQECLHCPFIHPELCRVSPPESGDNLAPGPGWVGGWMDLGDHAATMSMTGAAVAAPRPRLDERARRRVAYVALLPSLLVSAHPDYVLTHLLEPLSVDRTRVTCEWLADPGTAVDGLADAVALWHVTNREDWAACESVQRGLASGAYVPGPLAPREDAVHAVVQWFAERYLAALVEAGAPSA
jgi:Rieske 2Fe-2S family protein